MKKFSVNSVFSVSLCWVVSVAVCASASAADRRAGSIRTSDGVELKGEVWFSNPEVKVYEGEDAAGGRFVKVMQDEIASITFSVKTSAMEREWRFKNAGSDEKEFLDRYYPVIELKSETKTKAGQTLKGHVYTQPVFVRVQSRENPMDYDTKKFILKYQIKGEVGQQEKDVAYVTSITFDEGGEGVAAGKSKLTGTIKDLGKLEMASAFGLKRGRAYEGKVDAAKGTFTIANLPEDIYDVFIMTDNTIYVGLSDRKVTPPEDLRPLEDGDLKAIGESVAKFRDFFDEQAVLALHGDRDSARALVWQRRNAVQHDEGGLKGKQIYRLDVWLWHMRQTEWHVDSSSRANMFRYFEPRGAKPRPIVSVPKLQDMTLGAGETKQLELNESEAKMGVAVPTSWK